MGLGKNYYHFFRILASTWHRSVSSCNIPNDNFIKKRRSLSVILLIRHFLMRSLTASCYTQTCAHADLYLNPIHTHTQVLWLVGSFWEGRVQRSQTGHRKRPGWTNQQQQSTNPISQPDRLCSRKAKFSWTENKPREMRLCLITKKLPGHQAYFAHTIIVRLMKLSLH